MNNGDFLCANLINSHIGQPGVLHIIGVLQTEQVIVGLCDVGVACGGSHLHHAGLLVNRRARQHAGAVVAADFGNVLRIRGDLLGNVGSFLGGALIIEIVNLNHLAIDTAGLVNLVHLHVQCFLEEVSVLCIIAGEGGAAGNVNLVFGCG